MKKSFFLRSFYIVTAFVFLFNITMDLHDSLYFDLNDLPAGKLTCSLPSPDQSQVLNIYVVKNNLGTAVRGEITDAGNSAAANNVYWQTDTEAADAKWIDNGVISINDVNIDIKNGGTYDSRRGSSILRKGSFEGIAETTEFKQH